MKALSNGKFHCLEIYIRYRGNNSRAGNESGNIHMKISLKSKPYHKQDFDIH